MEIDDDDFVASDEEEDEGDLDQYDLSWHPSSSDLSAEEGVDEIAERMRKQDKIMRKLKSTNFHIYAVMVSWVINLLVIYTPNRKIEPHITE